LIEKDGKQILEPVHNKNSKSQNPITKQIPSNQSPNSKPYDLEQRTLKFAKDIISFVKTLPKTLGNRENTRQLIRSSGSTGANYIEANEALSKKDFLMRIKICRKEAKESAYWLKLIECSNRQNEEKRHLLIEEAIQLLKIFNSIVEKSK
jgi:four helix bundle protein